MMYLGIDPGASAGFALITGPETVIAVSCKTNLQSAFDILEKLDPAEVKVGLEKIHAIWGVSAASTFGLGMAYGGWLHLLKYLKIVPIDVTVQAWQKAVTIAPVKPLLKGKSPTEQKLMKKMHKDALKLESLRAAQADFPKVKIDNHDVADAINIARYIRLQDTLKKTKPK